MVTNNRGTSTLEFIVVLPVLLFVLFAIVELSRAYMTVNLATTAVREGARAGAVAPDPVSAGNARINQILGAGNWGGSGVTCSTSPCTEGAEVTANVVVTFQTVVPLLLPAMFQNMPITQTAVARYE